MDNNEQLKELLKSKLLNFKEFLLNDIKLD